MSNDFDLVAAMRETVRTTPPYHGRDDKLFVSAGSPIPDAEWQRMFPGREIVRTPDHIPLAARASQSETPESDGEAR